MIAMYIKYKLECLLPFDTRARLLQYSGYAAYQNSASTATHASSIVSQVYIGISIPISLK